MSLFRFFAVVAAVSPFALCGAVHADDTRYAIVTLYNPTNAVINYTFAWGDGPYRSYSVLPGHHRWHAFAYAYPNQNRSPIPHVRFDYDLSSAFAVRTYRLQAYAAPYETGQFGKPYSFIGSWDGWTVDLYDHD